MKTCQSMQSEQLKALATYLKLSTLPMHANTLAADAKQQQWSYEDYLIQLLELEVEDKQSRATIRRIANAKFPFCKTLDEFNFDLAAHLPQHQLLGLTKCEYIGQAEPVILMGEPGTGKTHLAIALGYAAAKTGYKVKFTTLA